MFIIIFLFSFGYSFSQNTIQKWNDYRNCYEYYDNYGNMVAYKIYNSYKKQWETYNTSQNSYITLQSTFNVELAKRTLNTLQGRYDININKVRDLIKHVDKSIDYLVLDIMKPNDYPTELDYKFSKRLKGIYYKEYVSVIENSNYNYSKNNLTYEILTYLENSSILLIEKELYFIEDKDFYNHLIRKFSEKVRNQ